MNELEVFTSIMQDLYISLIEDFTISESHVAYLHNKI